MKTPTTASLKKVSPENLARLGVERLAEILVDAADTRPDLKRRLRMELAAEQGADHLAVEIDKRLVSLETSRGKVSWRKRANFVADFDGLRALIAERLAELDRAAALDRLWQFMDLARRLGLRVRDRDGALAEVFVRAAADIGGLVPGPDAAPAMVEALARDTAAWTDRLPLVLARTPSGFAAELLRAIANHGESTPGWLILARQAADAAGDADAYQATFTPSALLNPAIAAQAAERLLAADRIAEAGRVLEAAKPAEKPRRLVGAKQAAEPDFAWETAWIDYLDRSGQSEAAQAARWASFERTLSVDRARAFTRRLTDFEDVEAESRAFEHAAAHADFQRALQFLMDWPALPEAAQMIQARAHDIRVEPELAELWAARLRARQPAAAHTLLRKAAARAFERRDFKTCDRLTQEADTIEL
jgi:hypothetical protein